MSKDSKLKEAIDLHIEAGKKLQSMQDDNKIYTSFEVEDIITVFNLTLMNLEEESKK